MENENNEILCIPGRKKNYAVEYPYIQELCQGMKVSRFPCLPPSFPGLINYKGNIIPLAALEEHDQPGVALLTLIIKSEKHMIGILLPEQPYIIHREEAHNIELFPETEESFFWKEKGALKKGDEVFCIIDVEKTMNSLDGI